MSEGLQWRFRSASSPLGVQPHEWQTYDGIRGFLPDAAIVTASHRAAELETADRVISLERYIPKS